MHPVIGRRHLNSKITQRYVDEVAMPGRWDPLEWRLPMTAEQLEGGVCRGKCDLLCDGEAGKVDAVQEPRSQMELSSTAPTRPG